MHEIINEWINKWINEWINEWINYWINELTNEWPKNEFTNKQLSKEEENNGNFSITQRQMIDSDLIEKYKKMITC